MRKNILIVDTNRFTEKQEDFSFIDYDESTTGITEDQSSKIEC